MRAICLWGHARARNGWVEARMCEQYACGGTRGRGIGWWGDTRARNGWVEARMCEQYACGGSSSSDSCPPARDGGGGGGHSVSTHVTPQPRHVKPPILLMTPSPCVTCGAVYHSPVHPHPTSFHPPPAIPHPTLSTPTSHAQAGSPAFNHCPIHITIHPHAFKLTPRQPPPPPPPPPTPQPPAHQPYASQSFVHPAAADVI